VTCGAPADEENSSEQTSSSKNGAVGSEKKMSQRIDARQAANTAVNLGRGVEPTAITANAAIKETEETDTPGEVAGTKTEGTDTPDDEPIKLPANLREIWKKTLKKALEKTEEITENKTLSNTVKNALEKMEKTMKKTVKDKAEDENLTFMLEVSSIAISTNAFGDFSQCTVISELIGEKSMEIIVEQARELWQKFIHQPQTARCLVFFLVLSKMCERITEDYEAAVLKLTPILNFDVSNIVSILCDGVSN
jgi:hypothetical protein